NELAAPGEGPVDEELRRLRMRRLADDADVDRDGGHALRRRHELDLGALFLVERVARILGERANAVLALGEPVEELRARVEALWLLFGELLPEVVAVHLAQDVPLRVLHARGGELGADPTLEGRVIDVLPRLRRLLGLHPGAVIRDPREAN